MTEIGFDGTLDGWRRAARKAIAGQCEPATLFWVSGQTPQANLALTDGVPANPESEISSLRVPRRFLALAEAVACHRDDARWTLLYRLLWRLTHGEPHLLDVAIDSDVQQAHAMAKAVQRDLHRMRAFVRFREITTAGGMWFVAWFEPEHLIVEMNALFFRDRFSSMRWAILTPDRCAHWDLRELTFTEGIPRPTVAPQDAVEDLWRTYYASIFNPARVSVSTMTTHLPRRYWKNLPEAEMIPGLVAEAGPRVNSMLATSREMTAARENFGRVIIPDTDDLSVLRESAKECRACPLWRNATCTVFGEGPAGARIVLVGEQPGDQEDRMGKPFVGPAGQLLDRALKAAHVVREQVYLTNAVKHFKWEPRGKRRLHQRPSAREVAACRPWLEAELRSLRPELIVCLGATAASSVLRRPVRVLRERSQKLETEFGAPALITIHPSALLRLPEGSDSNAEFERFVDDLRLIRA